MLPPDVIQVIQEINDGLIHWVKFSTIVVQLNSHIKTILPIHRKRTYIWYQ